MNENGQRLLELCTFHDLSITNSFFRTKPQHKVLWRQPHSKHWHQLDLILVRRTAIKNVLHTRSYHSADCDTDHSLVCCKIRMQPKKLHRTKTKGNPRIDVSKMSQPDLMEQFAQTFEKESGVLQPDDSATEKWEALRDTMYRTALATFRKRSSKWHDWFEAKSTVMTPVIEAKRAALIEYKRTPSERNLQILRIARSEAQQAVRCCVNEYWTELNENMQSAAITGSIRGMYDGIKKALGPTLDKTSPVRSSTEEVVTDKGHQLERWVEHCSDLYTRENIVSP